MTGKKSIPSSLPFEVAEWYARIQSGDAGDTDIEAFDSWLRHNPEHAERLGELDSLWDGLGAIDLPLPSPEVAAGRVHRLYAPISSVRADRPQRRRLAWAIAASIAVLILGSLVGLFAPDIHRTGRGEYRQVALEDGSLVYLNAMSELRVAYSKEARSLVLEKGEALFDVVHDPARPFLVEAGSSVVQALGTRFNVNARTDTVMITVLEGTVQISQKKSGEAKGALETSSAVARQGDQVSLTELGILTKVASINLEEVTAWRRGQIVLSGETLYEAVEKYSRHSDHEIVIADDLVGEVTIHGVFNAGDRGVFLNAIGRTFDVEVVADGSDRTILTQR